MSNISAIKIETESEGASWDEIRFLKKIASSQGKPVYLKIGGVEARTDISKARDTNIEGLIAPMVESLFGLEKFDDATRDLGFAWRAITIETTSGFRDLEAIAAEARLRGIQGITFGRGDFSASLGAKGSEDSPALNAYSLEFINVVKNHGLVASIGGNLTRRSILNFLTNLISPDYVETRRVVFSWSPTKSEDQLCEEFAKAIAWEIEGIEEYNQPLESHLTKNQKRIGVLKSRLD